MNSLIIGISGKVGSGKTTLVEYLVSYFKRKIIPAKAINFADALKKVCYEITGHYGYTQEDKNFFLEDFNMTVGEALQKIGTEAMRENFDQQVWVKSALSKVLQNGVTIIGDLRFPNEANAIKERNGILIRVNGDPVEVRKNSKRDQNHSSEIALDNYSDFDFIYSNIGTKDELSAFAFNIVNVIATKVVRNNNELEFKLDERTNFVN